MADNEYYRHTSTKYIWFQDQDNSLKKYPV